MKANKYDLSASCYRQAANDKIYYESLQMTLERLSHLEQVVVDEINKLRGIL